MSVKGPRAGLLLGALLLLLGAPTGSEPAQAVSKAVVGESQPDWSRDGRIAFQSDRLTKDGQDGSAILVMNEDGSGQTTVSDNRDFGPAWSPDGKRIAFASSRDPEWDSFVCCGGPSELYVTNANGSRARRLTRTSAYELDPAWSPDGQKLAFARGNGLGRSDIYVVNANGSGAKRLARAAAPELSPAWSPDGMRIAFVRTSPGGVAPAHIYVMNADGTGARRVASDASDPAWSPGGRRIAFTRDGDIWTLTLGSGELTRLTQDAGSDSQPAWSPDGTRIAFTSTRGGSGTVAIYVTDVAGPREERVLPQRRLSGNCTVRGTERSDRLSGTPRSDVICGLAGDDAVRAREGNDVVFAGPGRDRVRGGPGDDRIGVRDSTADFVACGTGRDVVGADRADELLGCEVVRYPPALRAAERPGDAAGVVSALRQQGLRVGPERTLPQDLFAVPAKLYGERIQIYEYADATAAQQDAARVSSDGHDISPRPGWTGPPGVVPAPTHVDWIGPPHFFRSGRVIVLYVGSHRPTLRALRAVLGREFAG